MSTVVLAGGPLLVRAALAAVVDRLSDSEIVGQASDGDELRLLLESRRPAAVVLDRSIPHGRFGEFADLVQFGATRTHVVVFGATGAEDAEAALRAGATGVLGADVTARQLVDAVKTVVGGGLAVILETVRTEPPPGGAPSRHDRPSGARPVLAEKKLLSPRELQVLKLLADGYDSLTLASTLELSPLTVKTHNTRMLSKVSVRDRARLVAYAYESGLIVRRAIPLCSRAAPPARARRRSACSRACSCTVARAWVRQPAGQEAAAALPGSFG